MWAKEADEGPAGASGLGVRVRFPQGLLAAVGTQAQRGKTEEHGSPRASWRDRQAAS